MNGKAPRRVPRWVFGAAIGLSIVAITRMLLQQRAQRRALRDSALVSASDKSARELDPAVAIAPDGTAIVAWAALGAGKDAADHLGVRALAPGARAWGAIGEVRVAEPAVAEPALVTVDDGSAWLAFVATGADGATRVYAARAAAGSIAFGAPADVSEAPRSATLASPRAAAAGDRAFVLFREDGAGRARLVLRALGGAARARSVIVEADAGRLTSPAICATDKRVYVAWIDPRAGVRLRASDDGAVFPEAREVAVSTAGEAVASSPVQCVASGDDVTVLYARPAARAGLVSAAVVAKSADQGRTFAARTLVREPDLDLRSPAIAREASGTTALLYYAGRDTEGAYAALRWARIATVGEPAAEARQARAPLFLAPSRDDPRWTGDHVGLASGHGQLGAAFVDNLQGAHVAYVELGP